MTDGFLARHDGQSTKRQVSPPGRPVGKAPVWGWHKADGNHYKLFIGGDQHGQLSLLQHGEKRYLHSAHENHGHAQSKHGENR